MRLDALLSSSGAGSRAEMRRYIQSGRVSVNGAVCRSASFQAGETDWIAIDGKQINTARYIYLKMYKPRGYTCTTEDTADSVMQLVPPGFRKKGLAPAGRLDKDSEGLLLLSNDGRFIHQTISPKKELQKTYFVELQNPAGADTVQRFLDGILLADGTLCRPAVLRLTENPRAVFVEITEGKYHQIRRMFAALGNYVVRLKRLQIGGYLLEGLQEGDVVEIDPEGDGFVGT